MRELAYIQPNSQTPCSPRGTVPVNETQGRRFFTLQPDFQTLAYFGSGTNYPDLSGTYLGALISYDSIGRACQSTPAVQGFFASGQLTGTTATGGATGSPVAPVTSAKAGGFWLL